MAVFVTMTVRPPDPARFEQAIKEDYAQGLPAGAKSQFYGRLENDPGLFFIAGEWDSHDSMHAHSDKVGEDFNRRAGTEGVEWETRVYTILG